MKKLIADRYMGLFSSYNELRRQCKNAVEGDFAISNFCLYVHCDRRWKKTTWQKRTGKKK